MSQPPVDDERIELMLANLLRFGVMLSASVVLIGAVVYLLRYGHEAANFSVFRGEAAALRSLPAVAAGAIRLHGKSIIQLGLLLLIATPVARVVSSAIGFAMERDYLYVALTLIVLAVLLYSLIGSGAA